MRIYLAPQVMSSFNSALSKLKSYERHQFAAELYEQYVNSSLRKMEKHFFSF